MSPAGARAAPIGPPPGLEKSAVRPGHLRSLPVRVPPLPYQSKRVPHPPYIAECTKSGHVRVREWWRRPDRCPVPLGLKVGSSVTCIEPVAHVALIGYVQVDDLYDRQTIE